MATGPLSTADTLVEQWMFEYRSLPDGALEGATSSGSSSGGMFGGALGPGGTPQLVSSRLKYEPAAVYKRLVVMMRSLYSLVRVLPTYKLYKAVLVSHSHWSIALQPVRSGPVVEILCCTFWTSCRTTVLHIVDLLQIYCAARSGTCRTTALHHELW
jgi:hypothetical protein